MLSATKPFLSQYRILYSNRSWSPDWLASGIKWKNQWVIGTSGGFLRSDRRGRRRVSADGVPRRRRGVPDVRSEQPPAAAASSRRDEYDDANRRRFHSPAVAGKEKEKTWPSELTPRGNWWRDAVDTAAAAAADGDDDAVDGEIDAHIDS